MPLGRWMFTTAGPLTARYDPPRCRRSRMRETSVKRELLFAVGAATIVVVAAAGCSSEGESSSETTGAASSAAASSSNATTAPGTASASATASAGAAEVTVDGQPQPVNGPVVCETSDNKFSIAIGEPITGVIVGLEPDGSVVHGVGLGTVESRRGRSPRHRSIWGLNAGRRRDAQRKK